MGLDIIFTFLYLLFSATFVAGVWWGMLRLLDRVQAEVHEHHNLTRQAEKEQRDTHLKDAFLMGQQQARLEALEKSEARTWLHCDKNAP